MYIQFLILRQFGHTNYISIWCLFFHMLILMFVFNLNIYRISCKKHEIFLINNIRNFFKIPAFFSFGVSLIPHLGALRAALILHLILLTNVLKLPMIFFDTTPQGRILTRFSKDIDALDVVIPRLLGGIWCAFEVKNFLINCMIKKENI